MFYGIANIRQLAGMGLRPEHGGEIARVPPMIRAVTIGRPPAAPPEHLGEGIAFSQLICPSAIRTRCTVEQVRPKVAAMAALPAGPSATKSTASIPRISVRLRCRP